MERRSCGTNNNSMSRRIHRRTTEELGASNECTGRSSEEDEESI